MESGSDKSADMLSWSCVLSSSFRLLETRAILKPFAAKALATFCPTLDPAPRMRRTGDEDLDMTLDVGRNEGEWSQRKNVVPFYNLLDVESHCYSYQDQHGVSNQNTKVPRISKRQWPASAREALVRRISK